MATGPDLRAVEKDMVGEAMTSRAVHDVLLTLCETYGSRFAGSAEERRAGEYLARLWRSLGLQKVHREPFDLLAWRRGPTRLEIVKPVRETLECVALPNTPPTPRGGLIAEFASAGDGTPDEFARAGRTLRGKMVMASNESPAYEKRWIHRMEKYGRAVGAGAVAFLHLNFLDGFLPESGSLRHGQGRNIPGVGIAKETGAYLSRLAEKGPVTLRLVVGGSARTVAAYNVVGELTGRARPEEVVLVGGHLDGHDISTGAGDNASGIAVITEAARVLAPHAAHLDRTVRFVAFGAEEVGLVGSGRFAVDHANELDGVRFMLNVDGACGPGPWRVQLDRWPVLAPVITDLGKAMNYPLGISQSIGLYSDNFAFFLAGVPTGTMLAAETGQRGRGFGHTRADTVDKPKMRNMQECAAVVARVLLRLVNLDQWPVTKRRAPAEVKRLLLKDDLLETLRWESRDPFAKSDKGPPRGYW
jgi:Zn-dependent M28 family amino/carboxypeptidase